MKVFLATHGRMADGMRSSLEILLGAAENCTFFSAYVDKNTVESQVDAFLANVSEEETKILVSDIYGGSVCQVLSNYIDRENTFVLTGVNLGLLLSLAIYPEKTISREELQRLIDESRNLTCIVDRDELDKCYNNDDIF